ncbi:MAG: aryl-sulfate sulfotransferase, partial [Chitinophagales bacterium]
MRGFSFFCLVWLVFGVFEFALQAQEGMEQTVGLFFNHSEQSYNGYTLMAPMASNNTYLLDNCGELVHQWESSALPGLGVYLLENGNLLRTERILSTTFQAGGLGGRVKLMNWEGETVWSHIFATDSTHQHHDVEYLPNGNILVVLWERKTMQQALDAGRNPITFANQVWSDYLIEIQPIGEDDYEIVWEWHAWDHIIQAYDSTKTNYGIVGNHPELIHLNYVSSTVNPDGTNSNPDWHHINTITYNESLDQIMLSVRNFDEIWVIDHSTTSEEATGHTGGLYGRGGDLLYRWGNPMTYQRGTAADKRCFGQHDAQWIPENYPNAGKIVLYNNGNGRPNGAYSTVEIISPPMDAGGNYFIGITTAFLPFSAEWSYGAGASDLSFYSQNTSGAHPQPNGNLLVCEGQEGHLFEVTIGKDVVWDYVNPVGPGTPTTQGNAPSINSLFRVYRYGADYAAFEDKDLVPIAPLELEPLQSNCEIPTSIEEQHTSSFDINIAPNPANNVFYVTLDFSINPINPPKTIR